MNELKDNLTDSPNVELLKEDINNKIIQMAKGIEFRSDKKEVMEKIQSYISLLNKFN